jgi:F-box protein 16
MLAESDQLWMPKCLRFGWNLNYIPSSFESGIWKQFYIENIKALQYIPEHQMDDDNSNINGTSRTQREKNDDKLHNLTYGRFGFNNFMKSNSKMNLLSSKNKLIKQPPWKSNCYTPNSLYRFNYLDKDEEKANLKKYDSF